MRREDSGACAHPSVCDRTRRCVMLHLTFCIGPTRFVIDARRVSQVVARVPLRALPLSEPYVAGLLDFRGTVLAVVDLGHAIVRDQRARRV